MQNLLRASAQWLVLESAVVWLISPPMYVKSLIGAFLCSFVHHSKSGKGFSLSFSQFYHRWLYQIWGSVVFVGYLTVGFVLGSTTHISPGRIIYFRRSSLVLEKVFLSKLPLLNCPESGQCIFTTVSVVVQYFSVFHSEIALQTDVGVAPFWCIFTIDWAKENYFDLQLKPMCYSDCELARVYNFKERISLGLISYFLCSCLLHMLQLCTFRNLVVTTQDRKRSESGLPWELGKGLLKIKCYFHSRDCRLLVSTKCAGMGCDIPDIRLTVCVGREN